MTNELQHFIDLARRGKHPGASGGEKRSARLAEAILNDLNGLDDWALKGFAEFCQLAATEYSEADDLLNGGQP